jgi:hypothetical protein
LREELINEVLGINIGSEDIHDVKSFFNFLLGNLEVSRLNFKRISNFILFELRNVISTALKLEIVLLNFSDLSFVGFIESLIVSFVFGSEKLGIRSARDV